MSNLKELKNRIASVKSTQKITSAMKMVAASRFRKAQDAVEQARPYAERMERVIGSLLDDPGAAESAPPLLIGTGTEDCHLIVAMTSDRGLCGGFNSSITRETRRQITALQGMGKTVKLLCIGRKARDQLKGEFADIIVETHENIGRAGIDYSEAQAIGRQILEMFEAGEFDVCTVIYNKFVSAMTQIVTRHPLIPVIMDEGEEGKETAKEPEPETAPGLAAIYEFEPSDEEIMSSLLPENLMVQIFRTLLESNASEHGARMTAMDNATRNAGDMIDDLSLIYNRTRQAKITSELIEIISGAEAL
ncbi:MAG: F0F1 ATP synthase subunit gamma [Rhodospirillales bacterium]|nr:F0F1 ATP synthase subunit gamma [Rhodospirillales bacterium]